MNPGDKVKVISPNQYENVLWSGQIGTVIGDCPNAEWAWVVFENHDNCRKHAIRKKNLQLVEGAKA